MLFNFSSSYWENEIYVSIDRTSGKIELGRKLKVVDKVLNSHSEISLEDAKAKQEDAKIDDTHYLD